MMLRTLRARGISLLLDLDEIALRASTAVLLLAAYREDCGNQADDPALLRHGQCRISIVTPTYNSDLGVFAQTAASVRSQIYRNWEWVVVDDGSTREEVRGYLEGLADPDGRTRVILSGHDGIGAATNEGIRAASGSFVCFLDHDDLLHPDALSRVAAALQANPGADIIYSDEERIDSMGRVQELILKPLWTLDSALSLNMFGHLTAIRRDLLVDMGGLACDLDGTQDTDLTLRALERARATVHIPVALYSWRRTPGSASTRPAQHARGRMILERALSRRRLRGEVVEEEGRVDLRVRFQPTELPSVAFLHLERYSKGRLSKIVSSLSGCRQVIGIAAGSSKSSRVSGMEVIEVESGAGLATRVKKAIEALQGPLWLLVGRGATPPSGAEVDELTGVLNEPKVAVAGPRVLRSRRRIAASGWALDSRRGLVPWYGGHPLSTAAFNVQAQHLRNVSAVPIETWAMRRDAWKKLGELKASLPEPWSEVEWCLRAWQAGYRVVTTPDAMSIARSLPKVDGPEFQVRSQWPAWFDEDPFVNPRLELRTLMGLEWMTLRRERSGVGAPLVSAPRVWREGRLEGSIGNFSRYSSGIA